MGQLAWAGNDDLSIPLYPSRICMYSYICKIIDYEISKIATYYVISQVGTVCKYNYIESMRFRGNLACVFLFMHTVIYTSASMCEYTKGRESPG